MAESTQTMPRPIRTAVQLRAQRRRRVIWWLLQVVLLAALVVMVITWYRAWPERQAEFGLFSHVAVHLQGYVDREKSWPLSLSQFRDDMDLPDSVSFDHYVYENPELNNESSAHVPTGTIILYCDHPVKSVFHTPGRFVGIWDADSRKVTIVWMEEHQFSNYYARYGQSATPLTALEG